MLGVRLEGIDKTVERLADAVERLADTQREHDLEDERRHVALLGRDENPVTAESALVEAGYLYRAIDKSYMLGPTLAAIGRAATSERRTAARLETSIGWHSLTGSPIAMDAWRILFMADAARSYDSADTARCIRDGAGSARFEPEERPIAVV